MYWTCERSTVFFTSESQAPVTHHHRHVRQLILELRLRYLTSLLDLLDGRHLSKCHQRKVHSFLNELGLRDFHCLLRDLHLWNLLNLLNKNIDIHSNVFYLANL